MRCILTVTCTFGHPLRECAGPSPLHADSCCEKNYDAQHRFDDRDKYVSPIPSCQEAKFYKSKKHASVSFLPGLMSNQEGMCPDMYIYMLASMTRRPAACLCVCVSVSLSVSECVCV